MNAGTITTEFERWSKGYGVIVHAAQTRERIADLAQRLVAEGLAASAGEVFAVLCAADRLASAAMWVVVHMTYANRVDLSGAPLAPEAFKAEPQGHTGGALNVVPAYVGYLAANLLTRQTRGWLLGQGHCVAAVEAVNALVGNLSPRQAGRYGADETGLTRLVSDAYGYAIDPGGRPAAPVGSHVTPDTAGGLAEGGYLGFADLAYVHMPLPGESLVAILSDGAFEEQRGSDWANRWWRAEDCGLVAPVMILNGNRIEQRTEIAQDGGAAWLSRHLAANGFDPFELDGADPAAFAWAVLEQEARLKDAAREVGAEARAYPVALPYAIARTVKGYGFPGAGALRAHNLPLPGSPRTEAESRRLFNEGAARLFVPQPALREAVDVFSAHDRQGRPQEGANPLAVRRPPPPTLPDPIPPTTEGARSPMDAMDAWVVALADANPGHRFRVGNPDELRSNHMGRTLQRLKHRVNWPDGNDGAVDGAVITALNEEAVVCAALGNKGGLNLVVSYEAFAMKMLGALRQEIIFARQQVEVGVGAGWIGVPLIATSHVWENGKNQQSHQDPTIGAALLGEMSDISRVFFPPDAASAQACLRAIYSQRGVIGCIVAPKNEVPDVFTADEAAEAGREGFWEFSRAEGAQVQLVALGAYQLIEARKAAERLRTCGGLTVAVAAVIEPGRLRVPRDPIEAAAMTPRHRITEAFPPALPRVLVSHTRPESMLGVLRPLDGGPHLTRAHGYLNRGGTLDLFGMLFANRCTWAHLVQSAADLVGLDHETLLTGAELAAVEGTGDPAVLRQVKATSGTPVHGQGPAGDRP